MHTCLYITSALLFFSSFYTSSILLGRLADPDPSRLTHLQWHLNPPCSLYRRFKASAQIRISSLASLLRKKLCLENHVCHEQPVPPSIESKTLFSKYFNIFKYLLLPTTFNHQKILLSSQRIKKSTFWAQYLRPILNQILKKELTKSRAAEGF